MTSAAANKPKKERKPRKRSNKPKKGDRALELVHRPLPEDDEATLERVGNVVMAVARRKVAHATLELKERVPLHVYNLDDESPEKVRYFVRLSRRLRAGLDRQQAGKPPLPAMNRRERRVKGLQPKIAKAIIDDQRKGKKMSRVLNQRLESLQALANEKSAPDYHRSCAENHGYANGLRHGAAVMLGVDFQPLISPELWSGAVAPASYEGIEAKLEGVQSKLGATQVALSEAKDQITTVTAERDKLGAEVAALEEKLVKLTAKVSTDSTENAAVASKTVPKAHKSAAKGKRK